MKVLLKPYAIQIEDVGIARRGHSIRTNVSLLVCAPVAEAGLLLLDEPTAGYHREHATALPALSPAVKITQVPLESV